MTHQEALKWQERLFRKCDYHDLCSICMELRSGVNGYADEWRSVYIKEVIGMLRARLETWREAGKREERMDNAVKELVMATIEEVESYDWRQK